MDHIFHTRRFTSIVISTIDNYAWKEKGILIIHIQNPVKNEQKLTSSKKKSHKAKAEYRPISRARNNFACTDVAPWAGAYLNYRHMNIVLLVF